MNPQKDKEALTQDCMIHAEWYENYQYPGSNMRSGEIFGISQDSWMKCAKLKDAELASLREQLEKVKKELEETKTSPDGLRESYRNRDLHSKLADLTKAGDEMANSIGVTCDKRCDCRFCESIKNWREATSTKG